MSLNLFRFLFSNRRVAAFIPLLIVFNSAHAQNIFHWKWQPVNNQIKISGSFHDSTITIYTDAAITKERFARLYRIIDEIEYDNLNLFRKTADTLSKELTAPFLVQIKSSSSIIIEMDSTLLNFPLEFLTCDKMSFALFRPTVFTIPDNLTNASENEITLHTGFIVRDRTADPENACAAVYKKYPSSVFKNVSALSAKELKADRHVDFILMSAHGLVDSITLNGKMFIDDKRTIPAEFFSKNNPSLVYLDGCQQGINWSYISALTNTDKTNFYLGPIVSNDSGESSTKTIRWFFSYLAQSNDPVISLWQTRKKLFLHYNKKIKELDVINKSFIFRVYKI